MNVVIACGGTGGHLFPGLAVAEVLKERGHEILLLISEKQIDAIAVRERREFQVEKIPSIGMPKFASLELFPFLGKFFQGFLACQKIYRSFPPDTVLGMGGFTSTAPILMGRMTGIPTFIHESNAIPGKANRLNARLSGKVLLGFQECRRFFPPSKVEFTGTPIRTSLRSPIDRGTVLERMHLEPTLKTVLVMGGSQGAHGINEAIGASLPHFTAKPVQFIHLTGQEDQNRVSDRYKREGIPAFVSAFYGRMEEAYSVADVAVARSGAASLTELTFFGLPSILIPYPYAAENHQQLNAKIFADHAAAELLEESKASGETLALLIGELLYNTAKITGMRARLRGLVPEDSALKIVDLLEKSKK